VLAVTPSLLRSLAGVFSPGQVLTDLRLVMICGETVYGEDIAVVRPHLPKSCACVNWCGASELGSLAFFPIGAHAPLPQGPVPAGYPAAGKQVVLLREDGTPAPQGETGEVVVTSAFCAAGYWNGDPELASRFSVETDGRRTYRSGDLGRFDANGALTLLGRKDAAVKVRGYLVEPAEVEAVLRTSPAVARRRGVGHLRTC
jgi:acyl-coenzyme A synthetase/AMP-(fatty) acid ligase